jgi:predicted nuclease of predicted toxin-antitoxin system
VILFVLLDQNVPRAVGDFLRAMRPDWQIAHVAEVGLWGAADQTILEWAKRDSWIIVTFDEDFADARMCPVGSHAGVRRLRVWPTTVEKAVEGLERLLREVDDAVIPGSLVAVDEHRIRIRRGIRHG